MPKIVSAALKAKAIGTQAKTKPRPGLDVLHHYIVVTKL